MPAKNNLPVTTGHSNTGTEQIRLEERDLVLPSQKRKQEEHILPSRKRSYYKRPEFGAEEAAYRQAVESAEEAVQGRMRRAERAQQVQQGAARTQELLIRRYERQNARGDSAAAEQTLKRIGELSSGWENTQSAYSAAQAGANLALRRYNTATERYNRYMADQRAQFEAWKGSIRDAETIRADLARVKEQKAQLNDKLRWVQDYEDENMTRTSLAELDERQALLNEELEWSQYYRYADLSGNADFAERSKYVSTSNGQTPMKDGMTGAYALTGFRDTAYDYINRNPDAKRIMEFNAQASGAAGLGTDQSQLSQMKDEEIATFNYLYATEGADAAYGYISYLNGDLNQRRRKQEDDMWSQLAKEHPVAASAFSVLSHPVKSLGYVGQLIDYATDGKIDQNAGYNRYSHMNTAIRDEVSQIVEDKWGPVGSLAYQTGMSLADNLMRSSLLGGNKALAFAIMGSSAAADGVISKKDRGLSDNQAMILGTLEGLAEAAIEGLNLDNALNPSELKDGILLFMLKNAGAEGGEEILTELVNGAFDQLIAGDQSEWNESIRYYLEQGMSEKDATLKTLGDSLLQIGAAGFGGAIAGGVMSGMTAWNGTRRTKKIAKALDLKNAEAETVNGLIESGLESAEGTESRILAERLQEKLKQGQTVTAEELSRLLQANEGAIRQEQSEAQAAEDRIEEQAQRLSKAIGREIVLYDQAGANGTVEDGYYHDGKIYINRQSKKAMGQIVGHELTHSLELADTYAQLKNLIVNRLEQMETSLEELRQQKRELYARHGVELVDDADVDSEIVAEYIEKHLLTDEKSVLELAKEQPGIARRIHDWVDRVLAKLGNTNAQERVYLAQIRDCYAKALRQTRQNTEVRDGGARAAEQSDAATESPDELERRAQEALRSGEITDEQYDELMDQVDHLREEQGQTDFTPADPEGIHEETEGLKLRAVDEPATVAPEQKQLPEETAEPEGLRLRAVDEPASPETAQEAEIEEPEDGKQRDSAGFDLTDAQETFFRDSVVRDERGRLLVMYHGTSTGGFNTFDTYGANFGLFGVGAYFTADESVAESYTHKGKGDTPRVYRVYLDIRNPMDMDAQADRKAWKKAFRDADLDAGYLEDIQTNEDGFKALKEVLSDEGFLQYDAEERITDLIQGMGYDGITHIGGGRFNKRDETRHRVFIAFHPEQIKSVSNTAPTDNPDIRYSISEDSAMADDAIARNAQTGLVAQKELTDVKQTRAKVASRLTSMRENGVALPEDIKGNTAIGNSSYGITEENTTICPRSLAAEAFVDAVSEVVGRPLSVHEQIYISQDLQGRMQTPECTYCYVATDRKAYRAFLGEYLRQRDEVIEQLKANPDADLSEDGELYKKFRGKRKATEQMFNRFSMWVNAFRDGTPMIGPEHLTNMNRLMGDLTAQFGRDLAPQIEDAMRYAQAASWAKKRIGYVAYDGHILNWTDNRIRELNGHYGLRLYSFSDFHPAFVLENMQMITDAAVRGLKVLAYTKDTDFVKIFAGTGANINVSTFGFERGGQVFENNMIGAPWKEAQQLREKYPNVGITFVATSDQLVEWAMEQDWIDVVIPYHLVRTGKEVAKAMGYTNYTNISGDKKDRSKWKEGMETSIPPAQHNNDRETYFALLEANGLTPRFNRWKNHPQYMKLVNECRRSASETGAVRPVFDEDAQEAAMIALSKLEANGYYQPVGGTVERMYEIAADVAEAMEQAKVAKTGVFAEDAKKGSRKRYSLSDDSDRAYLDAVRRMDMDAAQEMVDAAAIRNGFTLRLYHGTAGEPFYVFRQGAEGIHFGTIAQATQKAESTAEGYEYRQESYSRQQTIERPADFPQAARRAILYQIIWDSHSLSSEDVDRAVRIVDEYGRVDDETFLYYLNASEKKNFRITNLDMSRNATPRIVDSYVKAEHSVVFDADIGSWAPANIADILIDKIKGNKSEIYSLANNGWVDYDPSGISGLELTEADLPELERIGGRQGFEAIADFLKGKGADSIRYLNTYEGTRDEESYILLSPEQIKSAEPVVYDDEGNVIPLSERFDFGKKDIRYSLSEVDVPSWDELERKSPMKVVDITVNRTSGSFAERRKQILNSIDQVIQKPYLNQDTGAMIFITRRSYTHAFNHLGEIQLNAAEHFPEFIENAVLTHAEEPKYGSDYTNRVYTFFAAARTGHLMPVKLKVKEYRYEGQLLPENIQEYFDQYPDNYASLYDTAVLEVQEIEESPFGSVGDSMNHGTAPNPNELSEVRVTDLLQLVKGDARKYIPDPPEGKSVAKFSLSEMEERGTISHDEQQYQARLQGYPVVKGEQIVPMRTWVRANDIVTDENGDPVMDLDGTPRRNSNYGLVTGMDGRDRLLVSFVNKNRVNPVTGEYARRNNVSIAIEDLTPVPGEHQMTKAEYASLMEAAPVDPESEELTPEQWAEIEALRQRAGDEGTPAHQAVDRAALPTKAREYLKGVEKSLAKWMGNALGLTDEASWKALTEAARRISDEYLEAGTVSQQTMDELFDQLYTKDEGLDVNDPYYAEDAAEYRRWAKHDFGAAVDEAMNAFHRAMRYAEDRQSNVQEEAPATPEEANEAYKQLKKARRAYERVQIKHLLTREDERKVGQLLRGEITPANLNPAEDNVQGITAVYEAKREYDRLTKLIARYKRAIRGKMRQQADELLTSANEWKDKKVGIAYSRETMSRNVLDIVPDQELAATINKTYFEPVQIKQAEATRFLKRYRDRVELLNLSRKAAKGNLVSEAHAVQLLGEAQDNIRMLENARGRMKVRDGKTLEEWQAVVAELWKESPGLDRKKIENAIEEFRKIYDEIFEQMNWVRVRNGYEPINYRKGYFPHFQPGDGDSILIQFGKVLGIETQITALPTTINGLTHTFKPGIQWFGNAQERLGFNTVYDAVEGFDKYIEGAAGVIYHTENIQRLRAFATQIRYRTSDEGIRKQVDAVNDNPALAEEEKRTLITEIYANGTYTLSNFVNELDEYTNLLANKKSKFDRNMEARWGRKAYTVMKNIESRIGANMIAGNISSATTNFIPLTQAWGRLGSADLLKGMRDSLWSVINRTDDVAERSDFLTNRRGSDPLIRNWSQKISGKLGVLMDLIDGFVSESIVRGAYYQNLRRGLSELEAMHQADLFAASVMADRSKGAMPTFFMEGNPMTKLLTQFQLEVNNQFSEIFKDIPRAYRDKALTGLLLCLLKYFLGAFLFNELEEAVKGRRSAMDPIGIAKQFAENVQSLGWADAASNLAVEVAGELPFSSAPMAMFGMDGGRIPLQSAIPDISKVFSALTDPDWSMERRISNLGNELAKPVTYLVSPFGGGNQIAKSWKGIKAYLDGGVYGIEDVAYTDENGETYVKGEKYMKYPVIKGEGDDFWDLVRAAIFGTSALEEMQDWVSSGFDSLNAKQTAVFQDLRDAGVPDQEAYDLIMEIRGAEKTDELSKTGVQLQILRESQISGEGKAAVYYGMILTSASGAERALMDQLAEDGADVGEMTEVLMAIHDADSLSGSEKSNAKRDAIAQSALTDAQKIAIYREKISDSRDDDIDAFLAAKLSFNEFLRAQNQYAAINGRDLSSAEKATEFAHWVNSQRYNQNQKAVVRDCFSYYNQIPASAGAYDKLVDAGLDPDDAYGLSQDLAELEPEAGEDQVADIQKWRAAVDYSSNEAMQLAALAGVMAPDRYDKLETATAFDVTPDRYVAYYEIRGQYDADGNGSFKQVEVTAAIDAMGKGMTREQKAALWQIVTGTSSAKNNPYSVSVGQKVLEYLGKG